MAERVGGTIAGIGLGSRSIGAQERSGAIGALTQQQQLEMERRKMRQQGFAGLGGGIGSLIGSFLPF